MNIPENFEKITMSVHQDGNIFAIIGATKMALVQAGYRELANEYVKEVTASDSYEEALAVTAKVVEFCDD